MAAVINRRDRDFVDPEENGAAEERWWWDEVGVLVEHEVWHLPQLAEEQRQD